MSWKRYQCPSCTDQFAAQEPPRFCPKCGYDTQAEDLAEVISSPAMLSARTKSIDGHSRAMEEGANFRAEVSGEPSLKMTDMKDNLRAGDISAPQVSNDISRMIEANPGRYGFQGAGEQGMAYSQQAHTGILPNAGAKALNALRSDHSAHGGVVSDRPALETQQPGYRSRVR